MSNIERNGNHISVSGDLRDFHYLLAQFHQCVYDAGFPDFVLNMSDCTSAFQNSMLSVCAQVVAYRNDGIDIDFIPPADPRLYNLFQNTNWGFYLDPKQFGPSQFRGYTRIPATQYTTADEQQHAVNKILNVMLGALPDLSRSELSAFEWAINEITDNVLVHSESTIGGFVQVSTFQKNRKSVEFVVADAGVGIPTTLKGGHSDIGTDTEALDRAIREGVTRDASIGQGNGLYGSYRVCSQSNGLFQIDSGHARLLYDSKQRLSVSNKSIPYSGTLVVATVDFSNPDLLRDALQFKGVTYEPTDYVETAYEQYDDAPVEFVLTDECRSFGSRVSGRPLRVKLHNVIRMSDISRINVNFDGVPIVSSSFADEAFGKLFLQLGPLEFMRRIKFVNMVDTVESLVNKAIAQRMQYGMSDVDA